MSFDHMVGIVVAVLMLGYLLYVLINAEKF
jgi:K+-transporting ATPase KdpF subunit